MNKGEKIDSVGGSGRGNKGVSRLDDPLRPDCPRCGGFMKSDGKKEWRCVECGKRKLKKTVEKESVNEEFNKYGYDVDKAEERAKYIESRYNNGCKSFVITSAQNNTGEFKAFLESLRVYCKHKRAELIIIPVHYKNANAWTKDTVKEWPKAIEPYLCHGDINLGHVLVRAAIKIEAPSVNPLQGKQAHGGNRWVVFGNAQHAMEPVATPADLLPKRMYTTGSISKRNYSVSDRGAKADFNHVFGALTVNFKDSEVPFIRQINADDKGNFYDLDERYTTKSYSDKHKASTITPGDEHEKHNIVKNETYFHRNSIVNKLNPKYIVRNDILDGFARNHHDEKDPLTQYKKYVNGDDCYRSELDACIKFVNDSTPKHAISLFVGSNHHDHLDKWLNHANANKDFRNAELILELRAMQFNAVSQGKSKPAFELYCDGKLKVKHKFLDRNKTFLIGDVDHAQHGDIGTNGSRGSANALAKTTFKMTIGHSHGARIVKGVYQVGTSTGKLDYEKGLSDHSNTHCIQYKNGKRTLIDIIDGQWCEKWTI